MRAHPAEDLDAAHARAVTAAAEGLSDAALGAARLTGPGVVPLADAAVTSATPFLRAPLLAAVAAALRLHRPAGRTGAGECGCCRVPYPCPTVTALRGPAG